MKNVEKRRKEYCSVYATLYYTKERGTPDIPHTHTHTYSL